jgi:hypothetical protein
VFRQLNGWHCDLKLLFASYYRPCINIDLFYSLILILNLNLNYFHGLLLCFTYNKILQTSFISIYVFKNIYENRQINIDWKGSTEVLRQYFRASCKIFAWQSHWSHNNPCYFLLKNKRRIQLYNLNKTRHDVGQFSTKELKSKHIPANQRGPYEIKLACSPDTIVAFQN